MVGLLALFFCLALAYPTFFQFGEAKLAGLLGLYLGAMSWTALALGTAAALLIALFGAKTAALASARQDAGSAAVIVPAGVCLVVGAAVMIFVAGPAAGWHPG